MSKVKKFKVKEISGRFGEFIYLGANAENVDILLDNEDGTKFLQDLQSYIVTLEDTLKNLKILTSELKEETTTFKSNIEELSLNDTTMSNQISALQEDNGEIQSNINTMKTDISNLQNEVSKFSNLTWQGE